MANTQEPLPPVARPRNDQNTLKKWGNTLRYRKDDKWSWYLEDWSRKPYEPPALSDENMQKLLRLWQEGGNKSPSAEIRVMAYFGSNGSSLIPELSAGGLRGATFYNEFANQKTLATFLDTFG
jgi:hypothetical protein